MKKFFKITGYTVLALLLFIGIAPFLFEDQIADLVKKKLNESLNADIDFAEADLSLFRAFPDARLELEGLSIKNKAPFKGDTLFYSKIVKIDLPLGDLFNDVNEPMRVNELVIENAVVNLISNKDAKTNWDIVKETSVDANAEPTSFALDMKGYEIINSTFSYKDEITKNDLVLKNFNHKGTGDLSLDKSTLKTISTAQIFYGMDGIQYLSGQNLKLDADLALDLKNQKYDFLENKAFINDLELTLDGFVQLVEDKTIVDLTINTPSSDFKNFFAVIPEVYRENLADITTTGNFTVNGTIKGDVTDTTIPKIDIKIASRDASFKYAALPQKVTNIIIDAFIKNDTGIVEDTYINIQDVAFNIGSDRLSGRALVKNLTTNMLVDMNAKGTLDFKNLANAFPMPKDMNLSGRLALDLDSKFDMESVQRERYEKIYMKGNGTLSNFIYKGPAFEKPFIIDNAVIDMTNTLIRLNSFKAKTGNTDLAATGTIDNLLGFLLQDKGLKGAFKVSSNTFDTSDFMSDVPVETADTAKNSANKSTPKSDPAIKIPAFLDAFLDFNANTVLYDGLTLKNVQGVATIRDEKMSINNTSTSIFGGTIGLNGSVDTKGKTPLFDMKLNMKDLDIAQSFQGFDMFQKFVPIISALKGKITTDIKLNGNLNPDLTPILASIAGDAFAQLLTRDIDTKSSALLSKLDERLSFIDLKDIDISNITTKLKFQDGAVQVSPFDFKVKDMNVTASGKHSLTNDMAYTLSFDVPAKYFGKEGAALLGKLKDDEVAGISVPVPVSISGTFTKPNVQLNLEGAVKNLTNQIVEIQKAKLKEQGKDAVNGALNDAISGKNPLGGIKDIIKGKKPDTTAVNKPIDTTANGQLKKESQESIKNAASSVLNGLLKKKKKT